MSAIDHILWHQDLPPEFQLELSLHTKYAENLHPVECIFQRVPYQ